VRYFVWRVLCFSSCPSEEVPKNIRSDEPRPTSTPLHRSSLPPQNHQSPDDRRKQHLLEAKTSKNFEIAPLEAVAFLLPALTPAPAPKPGFEAAPLIAECWAQKMMAPITSRQPARCSR
jgi:hypothetical protein